MTLFTLTTKLLVLLGVTALADSTENKKQVIVMSLPGVSDVQYLDNLQDIADFIIEMDGKTKGRDHFFVIHDKSGLSYFKNYNFTNAQLIEVKESLDMWMRDFPPVMPKVQVKFKYRPAYLTSSKAIEDNTRFENFAELVGLPKLNHSDLVTEGGNVVENGETYAVVTERIYKDNSDRNRENVIQTLEAAIKSKVAVIPDPEDTTGHADGVVSFVEKDVLLVALYPGEQDFYDEMKDAVKRVFPSVNVVPLPSYAKKTKLQGFSSAEGSYANSLVTNNAVYIPFFSNQTSNQRAFDAFRNHTDKEIVPMYKAGNIPVFGGSLRCMTWQIDQEHPVAKSLFAYVENKTKSNGSSQSFNPTLAIPLIISQLSLLLWALSM